MIEKRESRSRWRSGRAVWLWVLIGLVLVGSGWVAWSWNHRTTLRYVTAAVTHGDVMRTVNMTGTLNPVVTAQVESYVSGKIKAWYCDYNTVVKAGQVCALIDPQPFQVTVDQVTAVLHSAQAQLAKDQVAAANQANVYAFDQKLIDQGIVSQETLNNDKALLDQERAQIQLDTATVAQQTAALHGAVVNLGYTKIVSPVDGMVITRYIDLGQTVVSSMSASPMFLIGKDMHEMQVDTNVSEADVGGVRPGERAYFTVQAYPNRTFWGTVRQVREGPITVQNVVTYDVVVDVNNEDLALYPGMTADAHIITAEQDDVLRVPLPATRFNPEGLARSGARAPGAKGEAGRGTDSEDAATPADRGGPAAQGRAADRSASARGRRGRVWVLRDGQPTAVSVATGLDDGTLVEVAGTDLKVGDAVVVNAVRPDEGQGDNRGGPGLRGLRP